MVIVEEVEIIEYDEPIDVYDIQLDEEECFIAEGVVVHNSYICIGLTAGAWRLDTGEPLPGSATSLKYPGRPPLHFRCRSRMIAVLKTYNELLKMTEDRTRYHNALRNLDIEKRQALDGKLPVSQNYAEWLANQSAARQRQVLGSGRLKLWKEGKIGLSDLIDQSLRPLTIEQLKALTN